MANIELSSKRMQISKANATMVAVISVASFVTVFSLVACKALLSQRSYNAKVVAQKEKARDQLNDNIKAVDSLITSYKSFVETSDNVLGGNPTGAGEKDGDNARIVLDALPSKYDFPALATSIEKLMQNGGYKLDSITGTDDEVAQQDKSSPDPQPQEIPFDMAVTTTYTKAPGIADLFGKSIRPFNILKITISGNQAQMKLSVSGKTYYQPEKSLSITLKEVK
jgi:hypothetical protein